jgi:phage-related protein
MGYFSFENPWYGDLNTETLGIAVSKKRVMDLPARDVSRVHVPGRCGDALLDFGSYQNTEIAYECAARSPAALAELKRRMAHFGYDGNSAAPRTGYRVLADSWSPGAQRLAVCADAVAVTELIANRAYTFTAVFSCKPQVYYQRGAVVASLPAAPGGAPVPCAISVEAPDKAEIILQYWKKTLECVRERCMLW